MNNIETVGLDINGQDIPGRHKDIVRERLENYKTDKTKVLDFDNAMDEIERDLLCVEHKKS